MFNWKIQPNKTGHDAKKIMRNLLSNLSLHTNQRKQPNQGQKPLPTYAIDAS